MKTILNPNTEPSNERVHLTFPSPPATPTQEEMVDALKTRLDQAVTQLQGKPLSRMEFRAILMGVALDFLEEAR